MCVRGTLAIGRLWGDLCLWLVLLLDRRVWKLVTRHSEAQLSIHILKGLPRPLRWTLLHSPNSILALSSKELLVINDYYFTIRQSRLLSYIKTYLALPLRPIVCINLRSDVIKACVITYIPFTNSIKALNETTVAVALTSRSSVLLYAIGDRGELRYLLEIKLLFLADNLSSAGGKLLIAKHAYAPSLAEITQTCHVCNNLAELAGAAPEVAEYC